MNGKEMNSKGDKRINRHCAYMRTFITLMRVKNTYLGNGGSQGISSTATIKIAAELTLHWLLDLKAAAFSEL